MKKYLKVSKELCNKLESIKNANDYPVTTMVCDSSLQKLAQPLTYEQEILVLEYLANNEDVVLVVENPETSFTLTKDSTIYLADHSEVKVSETVSFKGTYTGN